MKPLCFILMPFGTKTDGNKKEINFDKVYETYIKPAILEAGLEPIRADEEKAGGFIHKPMYERLLFCDFSVADLSFANANVFYELGIRHAVKPYTTVSIFETNTKLPFDTAPLRTMPYDFSDNEVKNVQQKIKDLASVIKTNLNAQKTQEDSPIAQLVTGYKFPELQHLQQQAIAFITQASKVQDDKKQLGSLVADWKKADKEKDDTSKQQAAEKIRDLEKEAGTGLAYNFDLLYSLLNAYKSIGAFADIIRIVTPVLQTTAKGNIYLKQQLALSHNKIKERDKAERLLQEIIEQYGPDPETNGLLGAVYKGLMDDNKHDDILASEYLSQAIAAYLQGFEADPRDYYPGVNALTLIFMANPDDERLKKFFPLVNYAVERQLSLKQKDYWVQATALELAALELNEANARKFLGSSLITRPDGWMKETTAANLTKIYQKALPGKEEKLRWLKEIVDRLLA
jgi:hypothetical protein